jgi:hypothetical protein
MHCRPVRNPTLILAASLVAIAIAGCQQREVGGGPQVGSAAASTDGACRLLETAQVSAALSGAKRGEADNSRQQYGISACEWSTGRGRFAAQYWKSEHPSAKDEASGLMVGDLDPLKGGARANVRYQAVEGVGEQAVAVVESKDAQRGILDDVAMLVVQRGNVILVLIAPELARSDRNAALRLLTALGQSAAARL